MALHRQIADHLREGVFVAHPASPWQRGTNENTNGLLHQYFLNGAGLRIYTLEDLLYVKERINLCPRKTPGWRAAAEIYRAALATC